MDVLFVHPNFPGQFELLSRALAATPGVRVAALADASWVGDVSFPGVNLITYPAVAPAGNDTHLYVKGLDAAVRRGQQAVRALLTAKRGGFEPEVIYVHPGWGDGLFLKDIFPAAKVISHFEYYYHARGADVGFDPEFPLSFDDLFRLRLMNSIQHQALEGCDLGICPTEWQRSRYPQAYQERLITLHEGIDTGEVRPDQSATCTLPDGSSFTAGAEVLTFVSRSLEPYRGYHQFMRALPAILAARPSCHVIIVGADNVSYGCQPPAGSTWKSHYLAEVADRLDLQRVHFTGTLPRSDYLRVLQVSRVHVYLTYPFVLSWSMLEAMATGCLVVASDTQPVQEVVKHGDNGILVPFFAPDALAARVIEALASPDEMAAVRERARQSIMARFDFINNVLPRHKQLIGLPPDAMPTP